MSQIVAGLDGVAHTLDPGPQTTSPMRPIARCCRRACRRRSTRSNSEPLFRQELGDVFIDYFLKLKRNETGRFQRWLEEGGVQPPDDETTEWEQREYFDFF